MDRDFDVVIIGSGASGAIVADTLVNKNYEVAIVEFGSTLKGSHAEYLSLLSNSEPAICRSENGTWNENGYPWTTANVGGGTLFYGGASFRYQEVDFN